MKTKILKLIALAAASTFALAACTQPTEPAGKNGASAAKTSGTVTLVVGASPTPHSEILKFVKDNLAKDAGLDLQIKEYTDYVQPNVALDAGELDANFFQHIPYFDKEVSTKGYKFEHGAGIHIEPIGIYSTSVKDLKAVPEGGTVVIPNDATNGGRALKLLEAQKLLTIKAGVDNPTKADIVANPKKLNIVESDAAAVPIQYADAALGVINSNFALENGLNPSKDALAIEPGVNNPYSNILAWNKNSKKLEAVKKLDKLLHTPEVAKFIKDNFKGVVFPAF
ncbi:MAG: MetQ/NlpA family ABC transporter substrate-binding protein [Arcanobacterium sp.]|nr:MetQ/NlpA family ABC transporter substrate-binding protein [Arcanobacterium sp.]MDY5588538.1 MetQ/NlpA family ABC transporter substrate-binding protein [Arcanobacterium sp.]